MSALGSLVVKLGLDYAQYTGGLDKSEQAALAASKKIQDTFDGMKTKVAATVGAIAGGLAAGFTIAAFKGLISGAIETGAALDDLRMQTGATVEALSGLVAVGKFNNMGPEQIGAAMNKLAANLAGASEESKGTGKALEALGIDFAKFKLMRPEDQMQTVAKAMATFEDGTGKAAVAMALYGKQGAQMLPFLHDLAEVETLAAKVTTEQAAAAANLDDNLTRLSTSGEAWKKELANGMIPALDLGAQALVDMMNGAGGLREQMRLLAADGTIGEWTRNTITGFTYLLDVIQGLVGAAKIVGLAFAAVFGDIKTVASTAFMGMAAIKNAKFEEAADIFTRGLSDMSTRSQQFNKDFDELWNPKLKGEQIREGMLNSLVQSMAAAGETADNAKPSLNGFVNATDKVGKAAAAAKNPVDALLESIDKRVAVLKEELSTGDKLTEGEKMAAEMRQKLTTSTDAQIIAGRSLVETRLKDMLTTEQQVVAHREELKALEATREARMKLVQGMEQATSSLVAQNEALRDEIEIIGLTDTAQLQLLQSRNRALILTKEATLAELERASVITGTMTREQIALEAEIEALRERNELLGAKYDRTATAKAASEAAGEWTKFYDSVYNGLSDSLYRGFEAGKGFFKSFWDGIKNLFKTTVLKLAVQGVMTGITGALGLSVTGANAGTVGGAGGSGGLGMLSGLGNIVSSGFDLITKGVSGAVGNAFSSFATSSLGARLGLSSAVDYGTGYTANIMTPMGSSIGAGLGMVGNGMAGYGISSMLSGGYTTGGNTVNVIAGIASAFFGPLAGVVGGLINRLFGRKLADVGIEGTFGGEAGFDGQSFEYYKGGLFRSDKTKYSDLDPEFEKALGDSFKGMRAQVAYFADSLGLSAEKLEGYTSKIKFSTKGLSTEEIQAKFQEALATANNDLAEQVLGTWETTSEKVMQQVARHEGTGENAVAVWEEVEETITKTTYKASEYAKEGEKAIDTLTRLSTSLTTVNGIFDTLGYALLDASLAGADVASKIADAFGGLDKMVSATSGYFQNYYTDDERRAVATRQLDGEFEKLGLTMPKTRAEYRRLVEAQDLNTEAGRKAYATLVMLSGSFAELNQTAEETAAAAQEAAAAAKELLKSQLDTAYSALERTIAAQRKVLEEQRTAALAVASAWTSVRDIARSGARDLRGDVDSTAAQQAAQGMAYIQNALTGALGGVVPDSGRLSEALASARDGFNANNYSSQFELDRDRLVTAGKLEQIEAVSGKQLTTAEQMVEGIDRQIKQGQDTLDYWKQQIAIGTDTVEAILSQTEAIDVIRKLLEPAETAAAGGTPSNGGDVFVVGGGGSSGTPAAPTEGDANWWQQLGSGMGGNGKTPAAQTPVPEAASGNQTDWWRSLGNGIGGKLPSLAVGTNWLPDDMVIQAHKGERVIPPADNRRLIAALEYVPPARVATASDVRRMNDATADGNTVGLAAAVVDLATKVGELSTEWKAVKGHLKTAADALDGASEGGALRVTPA